ncbi:hypothetical protein V2J09_022651 [Rumex salicifolius]
MAMAENEKGDTASSKEGGGWGTLEELLLACAVIRHGTESWDSIAMEVQKRANTGNKNNFKRNVDGENYTNNFANSFTPQNCEQKYHALKRRFKLTGGGVEDLGGGGREHQLSFMVDELRKLRVDELRRQLERHDVSIGSLQLKVKKLEDEREKSSSEAKAELGGTDLVAIVDRGDADERGVRGGSEEVADKPVYSEQSEDPEDGSFNESNSTSHKGGAAGERGSNQMREADPVLPESAPDKDCSSSRGGDGSYDLEEGKVVGRTSPPSRPGNSGEYGESVSESKREGKESEARQSSDVQSSVSLSKRKWRGWRRSDGVGSSGDEIETEGWSPANKKKDVKSQPLIKFLEIVRSHKHGLVFQRRLPSQETEKYRNLIRQHLDLETVQSKLDGGVYKESHSRLYRDLLLIFTNALLFFCKSSTEHAAAHELRKLVMKEIAAQRAAPKPKPVPLVKPDLESRIPDPVVKKPRSSTNIVVCRRRTNTTSATKPPPLSEKNTAKSKVDDEVKVESLDTKRKNNGSSGSGNSRKNEESSDEDEQPINQRRKVLVSSRKQGVVNFLKRMQQNAEAGAKASENEELQEERRTKKAVAGKKKDGDDGEAKRRISGRRSGKGEEVEKPETARRGGGGRPPTRKAAMGGGGSGTPDSGRLKRRRDGDDKEAGGSGKMASTAKKSRR